MAAVVSMCYFFWGRKCHLIDLQKVVILLGQLLFWRMGSCCVYFVRTNRSLRFHRVPNHDSYLLSWVIFLLSLQKFLLATSWGVSFCGEVLRWWIQTWLQGPAVLPQETVMLKDSKHRNPLTNISVLGGADWRVFFLAAHATGFFSIIFVDINSPATIATSVEHQQKSPLENAILLKGVVI